MLNKIIIQSGLAEILDKMKLAVIVCVLAACVAVKADPDDEDVSSKLTRLENIVLDLTASNVHMQQEMIQLKQELHSKVVLA